MKEKNPNSAYANNFSHEPPKVNLLLCCPGKVRKERMEGIINSINNLSSRRKLHLYVILSDESKSIIKNYSISKLIEVVYTDEDEWNLWQGRGDPVLHIELTKWADVLIVAPLDLNTLAKIAIGICDDLLTCTIRAWNIKKPLIFCPALPAEIAEHRLTRLHIETLLSWGYKGLFPTSYAEASTEKCYDYPMVETDEITSLVLLKILEKEE